jgi:hypothetical protein
MRLRWYVSRLDGDGESCEGRRPFRRTYWVMVVDLEDGANKYNTHTQERGMNVVVCSAV